jgi:hypothetical protein
MSTTFNKQDYEKFIEYSNGANPFMVISGYLLNCIDKSKTPISEEEIRLRVLNLAYGQMSFVLPEEIKIGMRYGQLGDKNPDEKIEYLGSCLSQSFYWWPAIIRGVINTLFEVYDDLEILNEDKLFQDLEDYQKMFSQIHLEYFKNIEND